MLWKSFIVAMLISCVSCGFNPCHTDKSALDEPACTHIYLPPGLCNKCALKDPVTEGDKIGHFVECDAIFAFSNQCISKVQQYVTYNPCDTKRAEQLQLLQTGSFADKIEAQEDLDYWVYSICEQCCDCIKNDADFLDNSLASFDLERGNCPGHAAYDICQVYSNLEGVGKVRPNKNGKKILRKPQTTPLCKDQEPKQLLAYRKASIVKAANVQLTDPVEVFLKEFVWAAQCTKKNPYRRCHTLESNQDRI